MPDPPQSDSTVEPPTLSAAFWAHAGRAGPAPAVEEALRASVRAGRAAHPSFEVEALSFVRYIAERIPEDTGPVEALDTLHVGDLYLACALSAALPAAIAELEKEWLPAAARAVRRVDPAPTFVDEAVQLLRERLLVPHGGRRPKIADYAGRGPLRSWLRAVAVTTSLNLRARNAAGPLDEPDLEDSPLGEDPTATLLRRRHRREFDDAFRRALDSLADRDVNLLRLHYLDGLSTERIGALHGVHRVTVARWLSAARAALFEKTREHLAARLRVPAADVDSLIRVLWSKLDVSLSRELRARSDDP